jgi:pyruvate/2-oxoglutarate dehydrogenase complex dihydrolipoamide acyltransferase (E2) component
MPEVSLRIPQIGEGLQEARLVAVLKQPGDRVRRDEPIYQMETDKAVMDVESPHAGTLVRWLAEVDTVLPIGADVALMAVTDAAPSASAPAPVAATVAAPVASPPAQTGDRRRDVPPRTRAYAKSKGLSDADIERVPARGGKLMPEDVDAFLGGGQAVVSPKPTTGKPFQERPMPSKQRVLASRLQRGNQLVVPGMMSTVCAWSGIEAVRDHYRAAGGEFKPSAFTAFAYCVAKAAAENPIVRSTLVGDGTVRTYDHVQLGIAVALPGDELVVAVIEDADTLSWPEFAAATKDAIDRARAGQDQANETVTLSITNMSAHGVREAMAVVVPPGVATIFLGEAYWGYASTEEEPVVQRCANVGITIDHRLINGVGGAETLLSIRKHVESVRRLVGV